MKIVLDEGAFEPVRAHATDAGLDLRTPKDFVLRKMVENSAGTEVIDVGVHIELPPNTAGIIKAKSGLNINDDITVTGTLDEGYTGSIKVKLYNNGGRPKYFKRGDKIAQLVIVPVLYEDIELVDKLEDTERGDNGFGSTGR